MSGRWDACPHVHQRRPSPRCPYTHLAHWMVTVRSTDFRCSAPEYPREFFIPCFKGFLGYSRSCPFPDVSCSRFWIRGDVEHAPWRFRGSKQHRDGLGAARSSDAEALVSSSLEGGGFRGRPRSRCHFQPIGCSARVSQQLGIRRLGSREGRDEENVRTPVSHRGGRETGRVCGSFVAAPTSQPS